MSSPQRIRLDLPLNFLTDFIACCNQQLILMLDRKLTIHAASPALCSKLKWTEDELKGKEATAVLSSAEPLESVIFSWDTCVSQPKLYLQSKDGTRLNSNCRVVDLKHDDEADSYVLLYFDGNKAEVDLSMLQRFADTFMKDVNLGVLLIDTEYHLVDISETACRILGLNKESVHYQSLDAIFASVPAEHQLVDRSILDGMIVRNHAVSWTNNQERYELLLDSNLLKNQKGETVGAYIMFKDVTNLRSLEEQVKRSDRLAMIGQIAAGTAHEIRNPLTSIKGFMQVLKNTFMEKGMEKEQSYTDIMLTEINRINELVSEFLLLGKRKNVVYSEVEIKTTLGEILPIIQNEAILYGVNVEYDPAHFLPKVVADRELLKQVFLNICKNGIEAVSEGGKLTITEKVDYEERRVQIEIHDSGPGIPNFLIDKIFDPFFTTKEQGTGLGLSVCQRIIHDMGGTIRVSSKGYGTTFTVCIPYS